jgi:hypothetical protein
MILKKASRKEVATMSADETAELRARVAELEERLAALEAQGGAEMAGEGLLAHLVPPEARRHLRAARREQLLAARVILDRWISRLERDPGERLRRRESIPVE